MDDINGCLDSEIWMASYNQKQYGCHRPHVPLYSCKLTDKVCVYCLQRQPASLEELALSTVLNDSSLVQKVDSFLAHLPDRLFWMIGRAINANCPGKALKLVEFMSGDCEPRRSLFDVKPRRQTILTNFLFYCNVYHKLKPHMECSPDAIGEILQYVKEFGNTYKDFWFSMNSAMKRFDAMMKKQKRKLLNTNTTGADGRSVLYVNTLALTGIDHDPNVKETKREYRAMKQLQKLNRNSACPVIFKTRCIVHPYLKSCEIRSLLEDIDPQDISDIALTSASSWSVERIDKLGQELSDCSNLSSVDLWQTKASTETPKDMASAMSKLFSNHSRLSKITLGGIPLGGTMEQYPLPSAEEWYLSRCNLTETDWRFLTSRSDLSLKALTLSPEYSFTSHPSLLSFIQKQAASLERLSLQDLNLTASEVCDLMRLMAPFNKLQELRIKCDDMDKDGMGNVLAAFMSMTSAKNLFCETSTDEMFNEGNEHMRNAMKEFCAANRCPPIYLSVIMLSPIIRIETAPIWDD